MKLLLCTLNKNKIIEIKERFKSLPIDIITLFDLKDNEEVVENGKTFSENALIKAMFYGQKHNLLSLADDTGLELDALGGGPGVFTNRYERTEERRNKKLLKELQGVNNRDAQFKTVMVLFNPLTKEEYYFEGVVKGEIAFKPKGNKGFGYDPIFYIKELNKTMAELTTSEKNDISHRGKALKSLKEFLNENINNI